MKGQNMPEWCESEDWCPVTVTSELLGRKWHPVIVHRLLQGPKGFGDLRSDMAQISDKVLSDSLEDLQDKGVIEKEVLSENPQRVRYSLTERGESLRQVIESMKRWGRKNAGAV